VKATRRALPPAYRVAKRRPLPPLGNEGATAGVEPDDSNWRARRGPAGGGRTGPRGLTYWRRHLLDSLACGSLALVTPLAKGE
jgi:hypothetical protein